MLNLRVLSSHRRRSRRWSLFESGPRNFRLHRVGVAGDSSRQPRSSFESGAGSSRVGRAEGSVH
jgi:hypothetical protein